MSTQNIISLSAEEGFEIYFLRETIRNLNSSRPIEEMYLERGREVFSSRQRQWRGRYAYGPEEIGNQMLRRDLSRLEEGPIKFPFLKESVWIPCTCSTTFDEKWKCCLGLSSPDGASKDLEFEIFFNGKKCDVVEVDEREGYYICTFDGGHLFENYRLEFSAEQTDKVSVWVYALDSTE